MTPFVTVPIISLTVIGYFKFSMGGLIDCNCNNEERDTSIVYFPDSKMTFGLTAQFSTARNLCAEAFGIMLNSFYYWLYAVQCTCFINIISRVVRNDRHIRKRFEISITRH